MASMSEFLSGFDYHGSPVIQEGQLDPTRQREGLGGSGDLTFGGSKLGGTMTLDPNDFVFGGPEIFARLLQQSEMDGGFLSDASQNAQFAGETAGMSGLLGGSNRDRMRAASQANMNPIFAERQNINAGYEALTQILGRRGQLKGELAERQFGAQEAFANMMAETVASEKQFKVNTQAALKGSEMGAYGAIEAGRLAGKGAEKAGMWNAIGNII
jgi:hypothetical protein